MSTKIDFNAGPVPEVVEHYREIVKPYKLRMTYFPTEGEVLITVFDDLYHMQYKISKYEINFYNGDLIEEGILKLVEKMNERNGVKNEKN